MVDWARASGLDVIAAGKGTRYQPGFHHVTPDDVWTHYGLTPAEAEAGGMNPQMFNSFLDGTKSAIEMTAVANATGLTARTGGAQLPALRDRRPARRCCRPRADGGTLHHKGQVEVIASERRGTAARIDGHLRWGVYAVFEAGTDYVAVLLPRVRALHRFHRALRLDVQALSPDRAGARHLGGERCAARRAHRHADRVPRRCGRLRQGAPAVGHDGSTGKGATPSTAG